MTDPILMQIQSLLEEARREAYERGYNDAIRRVMSVAAELPQTNGTAQVEPPRAPAGPSPVEEESARGRRAPRGSIERRVLTLLQAAPAGLTVPEIEALATAGDEPLKTPSIRVALQRLLAAGQVEREGRRWLSSAAGETNEPEPAAEPASIEDEPPDDQEPVMGTPL